MTTMRLRAVQGMAGWPEGEVREVEHTSYVDGLLRTERVTIEESRAVSGHDLLAGIEDPDVKLAFDMHRSDPDAGHIAGTIDGEHVELEDVPDEDGPVVFLDDSEPDLPAEDAPEPEPAPAPVKRPRARKTN